MKTNNLEQWTIASLEISAGKQHKTDKKLHLITNNTVTIPNYHISIAQLKAINHVINNNIKPNTVIEKEENFFLAIDQPDLVLNTMLQKLGPQISKVCMAVLWNPGGQTALLKRNMTIWYVRESDYMEKGLTDQQKKQ